MLVKPTLQISVIQAALLLGNVQARIWLSGRDGRANYPRGFGQEQPAMMRDIAAPCTGETCDTPTGEAISHHIPEERSA